MDLVYALDQPHLFFYVSSLHDPSCYQITAINNSRSILLRLQMQFTNVPRSSGFLK